MSAPVHANRLVPTTQPAHATMFGLNFLVSIAREIDAAARQQLEDEQRALMARLRALHHRLEAGSIDEDAFDAEESPILDRLAAIKRSLER